MPYLAFYMLLLYVHQYSNYRAFANVTKFNEIQYYKIFGANLEML